MSEAPETTVDPVLEGLKQELETELRASLGDDLLDASTNLSNPVFKVSAAKRPQALAVLKTLGYTYYCFAGGVDWPEEDRFEVLDHLEDVRGSGQVTIRCDVPRGDPRLPTATGVFGGADWHERETWELYGIVFTGHPKLRRLLLADWQEGFPMRKDEVLRARAEKPWPGDFFSG